MMDATKVNGLSRSTWAKLATLIGAVGILHSLIFIPVVWAAMEPKIDAKFESHARAHHPTSVTRNEFKLIVDQLNRIEARLERLDGN